jgi:hypothetical protein
MWLRGVHGQASLPRMGGFVVSRADDSGVVRVDDA